MQHNWHKMIQLGVPLKSLYKEFDVDRYTTNVSYERNGMDRLITKKVQLEMYQELLNFEPTKKDAPIFCISSPVHDRQAVRVGVDLMSHYIDKGYNVKWHTLFGGYGNRAIQKYTKTDVLFITNVVQSSTSHKLELLRDLLYMNTDCLRVIITAGWHGLELVDASQIGVHGLLHLGKFSK